MTAQLALESHIWPSWARPSVSHVFGIRQRSSRVRRMAASWCIGCASFGWLCVCCQRQKCRNVFEAELYMMSLPCVWCVCACKKETHTSYIRHCVTCIARKKEEKRRDKWKSHVCGFEKARQDRQREKKVSCCRSNFALLSFFSFGLGCFSWCELLVRVYFSPKQRRNLHTQSQSFLSDNQTTQQRVYKKEREAIVVKSTSSSSITINLTMAMLMALPMVASL